MNNHHIRITLRAGLAGLLLSAVPLHATLIGFESFQSGSPGYTAGSALGAAGNLAVTAGNGGFDATQTWLRSSGAISANATGLTHNGVTGTALAGSVAVQEFFSGSALSRNSVRNTAALAPNLGSYFLSGLVQGVSTTAGLSNGSAVSAGFSAVSNITVNTFDTDTGFHFGLRNDTGTTYLAAFAGASAYNLFALTAATVDDVFQLVLRLDVNAAGNETLTAWYAASGAATLTEGLAATDVGDTVTDAFSLRTLAFQTRNVAGTASRTAGLFDELRFGSALTDVTTLSVASVVAPPTTSAVPEPSTWGALGGAVTLGLALLRRRRRA